MENTKDNGKLRKVFATLGASNHVSEEREPNDYYATDPRAMDILLDQSRGLFELHHHVWECAAGEDNLANVLRDRGHEVTSSDLIPRLPHTQEIDFLEFKGKWPGDIVTNPPYKFAQDFVEKSLECVEEGRYVLMYLKLQFMEGAKRRKMFDKFPPKYIYVMSKRVDCWKNNAPSIGANGKPSSGAVAYAWYVWEKGFTGRPEVLWIN